MCGLHEIERKIMLKQAFEKEKVELMIQELEGMFNNIQDLRGRVEEFETKYAELMNSPQYREKLKLLKEELGLAGVLPPRERATPTIVEKLTGSGKFYNSLGVEILEVAGKKARENGGILTLAEVALTVNKERVDQFVQLGDLIKALKILQDYELIPGIKTLPSGVQVVEFLPVEISEDSNTILNIASSSGWVAIEEVMLKTKWPRERAERALRSLEKGGIARVDVSYAMGTRWYFPGLMRSTAEKRR
nr:EAP30/Vps36 family vacuolar-sorting protein [Candidatus Njordarchaeum guaymaensis]